LAGHHPAIWTTGCLYRRVNPSDANQYRVPNGWANFRICGELCASG
jgi:hypothetical protein